MNVTVTFPTYSLFIIAALLLGLFLLGLYTVIVIRNDYLKDKKDFINKYINEGKSIDMPYYDWSIELKEDQLN